MWERWVGDRTDSNILTPSSSDYSSTSFSFCWAAQPGVQRAKALCCELVLTALNWNSNSNFNWLQLTRTVCGTGLYNCFRPTAFCGRRIWNEFNPVHMSRLYLDIFDQMHLFLDWRLGRRSIFLHMCIYLCVYVCICLCVCMIVCMYVCMYVCVCMYVYWYICMYVYACICVNVYVWMFVCIFVCLYVCIYVYACKCVNICMNVCK